MKNAQNNVSAKTSQDRKYLKIHKKPSPPPKMKWSEASKQTKQCWAGIWDFLPALHFQEKLLSPQVGHK